MKSHPNSFHYATGPYVGLIPFTEKDAEFFFGRDSDIRNVSTNLRASHLTIFYGGSGVGKSSLLNAGVIPDLQKMTTASILPGEPPEFILVMLRDWANNPIETFRLRIAEAVSKAIEKKQLPFLGIREFENAVKRNQDNNNLSDLFEKWIDLTKTDFLVIFDQFEEFFLHPEFAVGENSFGEEFPKVANAKNLPVNFMISMRDDSLGKLDFFKSKIPELMKNTLRLFPLNREATAEAIRKPPEKYNELFNTSFSIEDELVETLLDELQVGKVKFETQGQAVKMPNNFTKAFPLSENPIQSEIEISNNQYQVETPYLQLVMMQLWKSKITQSTKILSYPTLKFELGGVEEIVKTHLDEVMNQFSEEDKEIVTQFIHFTVTRNGTKVASDTNSLIEWAELSEHEKPTIERILRQLSSGERRIFKVIPNRRDPRNPFYEVTHDALAPAILSWRKRENEARVKRKVEIEEEKKRYIEIRQKEEAHQIELEKERFEKESRQKQLEEEKKVRIEKEERLAFAQKTRNLERLAWVLLGLLIIAVVVVAYFWKIEPRIQNAENADTAANIADKKAKSSASNQEIEKINSDKYKEQAEDYKSLVGILINLQSGNPQIVDKALSELEKKASQDSLPEEYKTKFIEILSNNKIGSQDSVRQEKTLEAVKYSKAKPEKLPIQNPTIIFIHIQNESQKSSALKLQNSLKQNGFLAPGIENVGERKDVNQIQLRYFHGETEKQAVADVITFLKKNDIDAVSKFIGGYENVVRQNQFELWFANMPPIRSLGKATAN